MTNKRIGVIVDNKFDNDVRVRREVKILKDAGHQIFILCYGFKGEAYETFDQIKVDRINIHRKFKDLLFLLFNRFSFYERLWRTRIVELLTKYEIDILHVHDLYMSKAAFEAVRQFGKEIPIYLDLHENYPEAIKSYNWTKGVIRNLVVAPGRWSLKECEYLSYASKIITLSKYGIDSILRKCSKLSRSDFVEFPNLIDFELLESFPIDQSVSKSQGMTLLYFGVIAERRGIFDLLNVFSQLLDERTDIRLLLIGPVDKSDRAKFSRYLENEGVAKSIDYIPWISLSQLPSYMKISDIAVAPLVKNDQHEFGVANKIFQYMFGGLPIIASNCKPQAELIQSSKCGLIYSSDDQLKRHIIYLLENEMTRKEAGMHGYNYIREQYRNQDINCSLLKIYQ